ncbi:hypothetical protein D3C80_1516230 [compost metagenome]
MDHHRARAEHLLLKQFILFQQQADVGLEQLRLRLVARLRQAAQMLYARVRPQRLQAFAVTVQGAWIEHGLRGLFGHVPGQLLDEAAERR